MLLRPDPSEVRERTSSPEERLGSPGDRDAPPELPESFLKLVDVVGHFDDAEYAVPSLERRRTIGEEFL
jgi:hypothetical protein